MRIAYLNPVGQMGGAESSLIELLASVRALQPNWDLKLMLGEDGPIRQRAEALGVSVIVVPFPAELARLGDTGRSLISAFVTSLEAAPMVLRYLRQLADLLLFFRPEVIHTNGFKMHLLGSYARPASTPVVWHMHDYVRSRSVISPLLRWNQRRCAAVIANSQSVARDTRRLFPHPPIVTAYNAVDRERFNPFGERFDLDALAGMPSAAPDTVRVGLVATFARWKGQKVFLHALSMLPRQLPVRGYVIGGPIYQTRGSQWTLEELRVEAARLGLRDNVGFTGSVEDTAPAMRSLDIIVHASTEPEPFGMVIAEGMACGKAVIVSTAGGAAEITEDGKNAIGHAPGDAAALARQITRLVRNEGLRVRLGQAGRWTAERLFRRERLGQQVTALYRQVGGKHDEVPSILADRGAMAIVPPALRRSAPKFHILR